MTIPQFTATAVIILRPDGLCMVQIGNLIVTRPGQEPGMTWPECRELIDEIEQRCQQKMAWR